MQASDRIHALEGLLSLSANGRVEHVPDNKFAVKPVWRGSVCREGTAAAAVYYAENCATGYGRPLSWFRDFCCLQISSEVLRKQKSAFVCGGVASEEYMN